MAEIHFFGFGKDTPLVQANIGLMLRNRNNSALSRSITVAAFGEFVKSVVLVGHPDTTVKSLNGVSSPYILIQSDNLGEAQMAHDMIVSQNHHPDLVIGPALHKFTKAK